jgi:hypothetical protein
MRMLRLYPLTTLACRCTLTGNRRHPYKAASADANDCFLALTHGILTSHFDSLL